MAAPNKSRNEVCTRGNALLQFGKYLKSLRQQESSSSSKTTNEEEELLCISIHKIYFILVYLAVSTSSD